MSMVAVMAVMMVMIIMMVVMVVWIRSEGVADLNHLWRRHISRSAITSTSAKLWRWRWDHSTTNAMNLIRAIRWRCALIDGGLSSDIRIWTGWIEADLRRVLWRSEVQHMHTVDRNVSFDVELVDGLVGQTVMEVAELLVVYSDQKMFVMIHNSHSEAITQLQWVMVPLLLLPSTTASRVHHHCVLHKGLEAEVHVQRHILPTIAGSELDSKAMMRVMMRVMMRAVGMEGGAVNVELGAG